MEQYKLNGRQKKSVVVENNVIKIIKNKGLFNSVREKTIPIRNIVGVEVKKPGAFVVGFIQFQTAGGKINDSSYKTSGGAADALSDENSIVFADKKDYAVALKIKEYIENYTEKSTQIVNQNSNSIDIASQLEKFAELKDKGVLSEEEFQEQKQKLLSIEH